MMMRSFFRLFALFTLSVAGACAQPDPLIIQTDAGLLQGVLAEDGSGVRSFKGVPYARPPVGPDRWRPPASADSWDGVRVADENGVIFNGARPGHVLREFDA